jgi:hypothetical protein
LGSDEHGHWRIAPRDEARITRRYRGNTSDTGNALWLVDAFILQKRWRDARLLFDRLLELRNDVGLLREK